MTTTMTDTKSVLDMLFFPKKLWGKEKRENKEATLSKL